MSQFLELQIDILYMLWVRAHGSAKPMSRAQIFEAQTRSKNDEIGPVNQSRTDAAVQALVERGYIEEQELTADCEVMHKISHSGINWLESWYRITKEGSTFWFHRRHKTSTVIGLTYFEWESKEKRNAVASKSRVADSSRDIATFFWTKWGAIFGGVAIIVSVILWKFS